MSNNYSKKKDSEMDSMSVPDENMLSSEHYSESENFESFDVDEKLMPKVFDTKPALLN